MATTEEVKLNLKVFVTGADGMLGSEVVAQLQRQQIETISFGKTEFDLTNEYQMVTNFPADANVVINCAAFTNVEGAESQSLLAHDVNSKGVGRLANLCTNYEAKFIQISTDYVFSGSKDESYNESDTPNPINVYGQSKYAGECEVLMRMPASAWVLRTSWLYGEYGNCFPKKVLENLRAGQTMRVVADQFGSPTHARDLASAIVDLALNVENTPAGVYNCSNTGKTSWYDFAQEIAQKCQLPTELLVPISTSEYETKATRPVQSSLDTSNWNLTGRFFMTDWKSAIFASKICNWN